MNQEVTAFIESINQPWQVEVCNRLRQMVHQSIPDVEERVQYKKPHFLKNGKYAAVISPAKDAISFMIFNVADLELPKGFEGPPERKWVKIRDGQSADYDMLANILVQASSSL
ncbi:DUF1801 domain-containing protein [Paenibacillus mesophilus]|uniref:DUF1801 domain-containing protein n=1 Tax=Paenibacillus mesophilus TaxID=2582849 RepID=UPI00110D2A0E|nr:DUF1801 domain-containing protein [Paenibacillus mesophilus]TMV46809.1 DUF1801 domain-containing protein [Paenibacillus mesophilus]